MRILDPQELQQVSGGAPKKWQKISEAERADPGENVTPDLPGNRTGWCRGYGNMKDVSLGEAPKHDGTNCVAR